MCNKSCKDEHKTKSSKNKCRINRKTKLVISGIVLMLLEVFTAYKVAIYLKVGFNVVVTTIFIALSALWLVLLFFVMLVGICGNKND